MTHHNRLDRYSVVFLLFVILIALPAFAFAGGSGERGNQETDSPRPLQVVASTNILGDVVANVVGGTAELTILIPIGQNPHSYEPAPRAVATIERADIVFVNGYDLEENLLGLIESTATGQIVAVSEGIEPHGDDEEHEEHEEHEEEEHDDEDHDDHHHAVDPHVWFDPNNVIVWVNTIVDTLVAADPANADTWRENGNRYIAELRELDRSIRRQIDTIPEERRKIVVDHASLDYFAEEYGLSILGSVIPATTDQAEPSAQAIAALVSVIREEDVPAIFVGGTAGDGLRNLVAAVAGEAGRELPIFTLLTGSLAPEGSEGDTYIGYMEYNVARILEGLSD